MDVSTFLAENLVDSWWRRRVVHRRSEAARQAHYGDLARSLAEPVAQYLRRAGVGKLYAHQAQAVDAVRDGRDVVVVTGTASGKTLCYNLPMAEAMLAEPESRALYLFPTKALAHDQLKTLEAMAASDSRLTEVVRPAAYDGDTASHRRRRVKHNATVVLTNPDMLHQGILPHHGKWARFFMRLKLVVIDELHTYRGIFGSNVAGVLRRLQRVAEHYGRQLQFVFCSATVGNAAELASQLIGREVDLVDVDASPRGQREIVVHDPPVARPGSPYRRSAVNEAVALWCRLVEAGVQTIVFARTRAETEMIYRKASQRLARRGEAAPRIRAYRGGYLPETRRQIEQELFEGKLRGVVGTSALELGIDIGGLDACIVVGYPGTISSFRQQAGRAGRRSGTSLVVYVAANDPTDRYLAAHPEHLLTGDIESAVVDPDNPYLLAQHLACAAFELPLTEGDARWFGPATADIIELLAEAGHTRAIHDRWYWSDERYPAAQMGLRTITGDNLTLQVMDESGIEAVGVIDRTSAPWTVYPGGIYLHEGRTFAVRSIDYDNGVVDLAAVEADYYTAPAIGYRISNVQVEETASVGPATAGFGAMHVSTRTTGFRRYRFSTGAALGGETVETPPVSFDTRGMVLSFEAEGLFALLPEAPAPLTVLAGLKNLLQTVLPLSTMCDRRDISVVLDSEATGRPSIIAYDRYVGGLGFSRRGFDRLSELLGRCLETVATCSCEGGCPSCVGPAQAELLSMQGEGVDASWSTRLKAPTTTLLERLLETTNRPDFKG